MYIIVIVLKTIRFLPRKGGQNMTVKKSKSVNNVYGFFINSIVLDDHGLPVPLEIGEKLSF
jgi:hypothetical protein